jgi:hypothetical protein
MSARLQAFWFGRVPVAPMAVARVLLGGTLLIAYLWLLPSFDRLLGPDGLLGASFHDQAPGPTVGRSTTASYRLLQHLDSRAALWSLYVVLLVSCLLVTVGWRPRLTGAVALLLHLGFHGRNEFVFWGWPEIVGPFLLYVLLSPSHRRFSVDAWLARRRAPGRSHAAATMTAWPMRLLQLHVCTVYVTTAWSRLDNPAWRDGSMLERILADGTFSRFPALGGAPGWLLAALTFAAWGLELVTPVGLASRQTRTATALALIGMHAMLELLTKVGGWNVVMTAGLLTFLPASTWTTPSLLTRIARRVTGGDTRPTRPPGARPRPGSQPLVRMDRHRLWLARWFPR